MIRVSVSTESASEFAFAVELAAKRMLQTHRDEETFKRLSALGSIIREALNAERGDE
jgi:hypothetical protein